MRVDPRVYSLHHARHGAFVSPAVAIVNINPNIPDKQSISISFFLSLTAATVLSVRTLLIVKFLLLLLLCSYLHVSSLLPMKHDF
jgi:hypothetical protein